MVTKYLLILGIGHLLGDFYFQTEKMAKDKDKQYKGVLIHALEYYMAVLLVILPVFSLDMLFAATCAAAVHFAIDMGKYMLVMKKKSRKSAKIFVVDQCIHLVSILLLAYWMQQQNFCIGHICLVEDVLHTYGCDADNLTRWVLAILLIHKPTNIFVRNFLRDYKPKDQRNETVNQVDHKAGRRIGTIERLIMLLLLSTDQYAAMGLVLTAKSIARYDKIAKNENFAEYYLLGTLISTLCVIVIGKLVLCS